MSKVSGLILDERPHIGTVTPPDAFEDRSRFVNNGTHTAITWVQLPSQVWVRNFDGATSYIQIAHAASLTFGIGDFSLETWVYPDSISGIKMLVIKVSGWDVGGVQVGYLLYISDVARLYIQINNGVVQRYGMSPVSSLIVSKWQHIVAGRISGSPFISINGVAQIITMGGGGNFAASVDNVIALRLGYDATVNRRYDGFKNMVRISSYALSATEIRKRFEATRHWFGV